MPESASNAASGQAAVARVVDPASPGAAKAGVVLTVATPSTPKLAAEGLLAAAAAFVTWGAFPLYLKPLHDVPSLQIIAHRISWACVLVVIWIGARGELGNLRKQFADPAIVARLTISAFLISVNWLGYVWGVGHGHVVEASLGYFINPLANVLLGVFFLRERLNVAQWTAVGIAAAAVVYIAVATGAPPWIALTIAASFSLYGFMRKVVHVEALQGLAVETLLLLPLALGYLIWCEATGVGAFGHASAGVDALLVGCGPITAIPLFLFAFGARRIPYSTLGLLLYIAPSLQLLAGIFLYHEPFAGARAFGFVLIWLALVIYAGDGVWRSRRA
jgi:chloramphenicol-sensitive protein RarD